MTVNAAETRATLLARLRQNPHNPASWNEFVDVYGPVILAWCRYWKLQEADARDVTQNVLMRLTTKLPAFNYNPEGSFRAWLKTLTHHAWQDFVHRHAAPDQGSGDTAILNVLRSVTARDDLEARIEAAFDREILAAAVEAVQNRVAPQTWEAYRLTVLIGMSGEDAAAQIPMQIGQVYVAKSRVQKLLQQEVRRLESLSEV